MKLRRSYGFIFMFYEINLMITFLSYLKLKYCFEINDMTCISFLNQARVSDWNVSIRSERFSKLILVWIFYSEE
jgi:hypothetical protein